MTGGMAAGGMSNKAGLLPASLQTARITLLNESFAVLHTLTYTPGPEL